MVVFLNKGCGCVFSSLFNSSVSFIDSEISFMFFKHYLFVLYSQNYIKNNVVYFIHTLDSD